jgi:hypothetical protein
MEMEQMMAHLVAEIRTNREEMRAGQESTKENMLANINANQEKSEANLKEMKAGQELL